LAALFLLWNRHFLKLDAKWTTTLYFVLAYDAAIYSDFVAGNISMFEQLGLWLGFMYLLKEQYARFCFCIILVAQFKGPPVFFAILPLLVPPRPQWKWFAACCAGFVGVFSLNAILQPELLRDFIRLAPTLDERGVQSPGTLAIIRDAFDAAGGAHFSSAT